MTIPISYMGTKRYLAAKIAEVIESLRPGPMLDLFAGLGTIASATASTRTVWLNDLSSFGSLAARAVFLPSPSHPDSAHRILSSRFFLNHRRMLTEKYRDACASEEASLDFSSTLQNFVDSTSRFPYYKRDNELFHDWFEGSETADVFTTGYSGTYIGLMQAIDIDSIRYSISQIEPHIFKSERDQLILALCISCSKVSTSPGHFAQYLSPNMGNISRIKQQRRRSIATEFLSSYDIVIRNSGKNSSSSNRVYNDDARNTLTHIQNDMGDYPGVIYADPPYTAEQYSRYYHLLDTLVSYRKKPLSSKGRYPDDRPVSDFSLKSKAPSALTTLVYNASKMGSDIVMSYPSRVRTH